MWLVVVSLYFPVLGALSHSVWDSPIRMLVAILMLATDQESATYCRNPTSRSLTPENARSRIYPMIEQTPE